MLSKDQNRFWCHCLSIEINSTNKIKFVLHNDIFIPNNIFFIIETFQTLFCRLSIVEKSKINIIIFYKYVIQIEYYFQVFSRVTMVEDKHTILRGFVGSILRYVIIVIVLNCSDQLCMNNDSKTSAAFGLKENDFERTVSL